MRGTGILLLFLVVVIGGIGVWMQRSRPELFHPAGEASGGERPPRRVSLLTEAIGYIGTILVLAGASTAVGQRWDDISSAWQLTILGIATLLFLGVGLFIRSASEPAFQRLTGVTWAVSVAAFAGGAAVVNQMNDTSGETAFLTIAAPATAYAAVLWWAHKHAIQQVVLFLGVLLSLAAVINRAVESPDAWLIAVPLCLLVALIAPATIGEPNALRFGLGIGTAGTVMALSVIARFTPALALSSVAMLGYVIGAVTYYFGDTLGVPASLAIAGLVILGLAAVATRWHWFGKKHPPADLPPASDGDGDAPTRREHHHAA